MDWIQVLAETLATGLVLGVPAYLVWRIHKTHENVRMHNIGRLSQKEYDLLQNFYGGLGGEEGWLIKGEEYVPASFVPDFTFYWELDRVPRRPVAGYTSVMSKLLLYGLMKSTYYSVPGYVYQTTVYGRLVYLDFDLQLHHEHRAQRSWGRRISRALFRRTSRVRRHPNYDKEDVKEDVRKALGLS